MNDPAGGPEPPEKTNPTPGNSSITKTLDSEGFQRNIDIENKYKLTDPGPYFVYVEHSDKNLGRLFPVRVGHYLLTNNLFKNHIDDIKSIGINRVKIIVKSAKVANALVNNEVFTSKNLISYIPKFYTHRKGIIRMVDTFLDEEFILSSIESNVQVTEVKRMTRRIIDEEGQPKIIKRQIVILTFAGSTIPKSVKLNLCNFPVEPYIYPVVQCHKCLRYGHTDKLCKSEVRCGYCSENHSSKICNNKDILYCVFCKADNHSSIDKRCPVYINQRNIKQTMASQNLSFKEAESVVNNPSYAKVLSNNRFAVLADPNNFPPLPSTSQVNAANLSSHPSRPIRLTNSQHYRKRKAAKSPVRPNTPPPLRKQKQTVLPNPHRDEFMFYKESLVEQITLFINGLIVNFFPDPSKHTEVINALNVKESLSALFSNPDNTVQDLQTTEDEEY